VAAVEDVFPLFGLRVRTPRLELRLAREHELDARAAAVRAGIYEPGRNPFPRDWAELPSPELERSVYKAVWRDLGNLTPERWKLPLSVFLDGELIGDQGIFATDFHLLGSATTGSWLTRAQQGRGIGKEMRAGALELIFTGLGAVEAISEAFATTMASIGVSRSLGYELDGIGRFAARGQAIDDRRFRLTRERWQATRSIEVELEGVEPCLEMLGAPPAVDA
jgi:RimJ/RimL family protein N-acetyltransferase